TRAGLPRAQHRVPLPMAHLGARFGRRRAGADRTFAREPAAAVVAAVALAALLARAAQVLVQLPAVALVRPEIAIDRLVADPELLVEPQPPGDLLGLQSSRTSAWIRAQSLAENRRL